MIIIGITGSIGMGKTTICSMLKFFNIPIFDADKEVNRILESNKKVIDKIQKIWPETLLFEPKIQINKVALARKIFWNKNNRKLLEEIIHPVVKQKRARFIKDHFNSKFVGLDIPLLYETKTNEICNYIFLVNTSKEIQKKRVLKRPNMTKKKFELINNVQWSYNKKKKQNPFVINTSYGKLFSFLQVLIYLIIILIKRRAKND